MTYNPPPSGPGQPQYPGTPGAPPPAWQPQAKGFFGALFDFSFNHFITPSIIRVLYILGFIGIALSYLSFIVYGFLLGAGPGLFFLLFGAILAVIELAFWRVTLEFFLSVVRMSEDIHNHTFPGAR
ncbi:MAG TPA: DUF4282 domain-containing protein [Pseudonocardiaceae bacterium]|nr:DUF4282 domain-containing protein [Pseudonocardiaceae bacterium]